MKTKFTPCLCEVNGYAIETCGKKSLVLGSVNSVENTGGIIPVSEREARANALLWAASTDLYAALEKAAESMEWAARILDVSPISHFAENISEARAALKKAVDGKAS